MADVVIAGELDSPDVDAAEEEEESELPSVDPAVVESEPPVVVSEPPVVVESELPDPDAVVAAVDVVRSSVAWVVPVV